jgi:sulfur carrier protein
MSVTKLFNQLDVNRESVLVICNGTLIPSDAMLDDDAVVEIRPVISGGA